MIPQVLSFWVLPGVEIGLGQAPEAGLGVLWKFFGVLLGPGRSLEAPWVVPKVFCHVYYRSMDVSEGSLGARGFEFWRLDWTLEHE